LVDVPVVVVVLEAAGGLDLLKQFNDRVEAAPLYLRPTQQQPRIVNATALR
jgi:hypothetical protein